MIMMTGLMLLFYFTGLLESTASSTLLNLLLDPVGFQNNEFSTEILIILSGIVIAAVSVGFFSGTNTELVLMGAFSIFLLGLMWDFLAVSTKVFSVNPVLGILIFSPLLILWIVTVIEFFRGTET